MNEAIRNCEFSFKCPKTWEALEKTPIDSQRYCGQCEKIVHHCRTAAELQWAIVRNLCVAVNVPAPAETPTSPETVKYEPRDLDSLMAPTIGIPRSDYNPLAPDDE